MSLKNKVNYKELYLTLAQENARLIEERHGMQESRANAIFANEANFEKYVIGNLKLKAENTALNLRIERLEKALKSIASNTCCETCQEARKVASQALAHEGTD